MSKREELLTPVGRLVQGSLYDPQTTDVDGKPLTYRTGQNAGQPKVNYYFAIAILKGAEKHWAETPWGQIVWKTGHEAFPNGQADSPTFAWKITDGDSTVPNSEGRRPCDAEGSAGHWVLRFSGGFASTIYNSDGTQVIAEPHAVNLGDYIQVYGSVTGNGSNQKPGVFLNHNMIALAGYGQRIVLGADPKAVGFGQSPLPPGVSPTPVSTAFAAAPPPPVAPHTDILMPPLPVAPVRTMTVAANGASYEQLIAAGWTDALLIAHGMMSV